MVNLVKIVSKWRPLKSARQQYSVRLNAFQNQSLQNYTELQVKDRYMSAIFNGRLLRHLRSIFLIDKIIGKLSLMSK